MKGTTNCQKTFQSNKNFRRFAYRIGNVLCITPWFDFEKEDLKSPLLNKACAITYCLALGILLVIAKVEEPSEVNIFEKFLCIFSSAISIFLTEFLIFGSTFIQQHTWKNFLRRLSATQPESGWDCRTIRSFYIQFTLGHVFFIGNIVYQWSTWYVLVGRSFVLSFISSSIQEYYCLFYTLVASNIALVIKCMYQDVNNLLEKYVGQYYLNLQEEESEEKFKNYILHVGKHYRHICELVDYLNKIFGWVSLLIFWHAIVQMLRCANFVLAIMDDPRFSWTVFISLLVVAMLNMCESASIILSCEMAASAGEKLERISYRLQEKFDVDSPCRRELFNLADIVRSHKPRFTAASFFVINKGTTLGIIHITTTYLIVLIQFNTKIHEAYFKNST